MLDYGPGGLLGAQRDLVLRELGLASRSLDVREALRNLHVARRRRRGARAAATRRPSSAFGDTPDEQLLRGVLMRGYFDPAASHEAAARELHLSRAAYFRRLRSASERVAEWLARAR